MTKKLAKIVFFGSGPVAKKSLSLLADSFEIECVITKPSTQKDMSDVVPETTVKTASSSKELGELVINSKFESRIALLIDFGIIVGQEVIDSFPLGIVNSHFSLLPEWRGADPITFSLLSGQNTTGVSLMLISLKMDVGNIIGFAELDIDPKDTSATLTDKLISLSDELLKQIIPQYLSGEIIDYSQEDVSRITGKPYNPTYSNKLTKSDGSIDWKEEAVVIERKIRAFYEWPKTRTKLNNLDLIIREAEVVKQQGKPGEYKVSKNELIIFCGKDALSIKKIQPSAKKEMPISAFLAGYSL